MDTSSTSERLHTVCLVILTGIAFCAALSWLKPVMVPFVLAIFMALAVTPVVDFQVKHFRFPRILAIVTTVILALLFLVVIGSITSSSITDLSKNIDVYGQQVEKIISKTVGYFPLEKVGIDSKKFDPSMFLDAVKSVIVTTTGSALAVLSQGVLVLLMVVFLQMKRKLAEEYTGLLGEIEKQVMHYVITKIMISFSTAVLVGATLWLLGVDFALAFAFFAFVLNFIPSVGSLISTALPLPILFFSPDSTWAVIILALVIPGIIQFALGNVVEPKLMGDALDLHPITLLLALIFWSMLWGPVGMFLATPLTAMMKIVLSRIEPTRPFSELLAGRFEALEAQLDSLSDTESSARDGAVSG